jgi:hypothetical protein
MGEESQKSLSLSPPRRWWQGLIIGSDLWLAWKLYADGLNDNDFLALMLLVAGLTLLIGEYVTGWRWATFFSPAPPRRWWIAVISAALALIGYRLYAGRGTGDEITSLGAMILFAAALAGFTCELVTGWKNLPLISVSLMILFGGLFGFGSKFLALVKFALESDGEMDAKFAIAPVVNYLLASAGFLMMVLWAAANGMFRDIEQPKRTMLDVEAMLDERRHEERYSDSVMT